MDEYLRMDIIKLDDFYTDFDRCLIGNNINKLTEFTQSKCEEINKLNISERYIIKKIIHVGHKVLQTLMHYTFVLCLLLYDENDNEIMVFVKILKYPSSRHFPIFYSYDINSLHYVSHMSAYENGIYIEIFNKQKGIHVMFLQKNLFGFEIKFVGNGMTICNSNSFDNRSIFECLPFTIGEFDTEFRRHIDFISKLRHALQYYNCIPEDICHHNNLIRKIIGILKLTYENNDCAVHVYGETIVRYEYTRDECDIIMNAVQIFEEENFKCDGTCLPLLLLRSVVYENTLLITRKLCYNITLNYS